MVERRTSYQEPRVNATFFSLLVRCLLRVHLMVVVVVVPSIGSFIPV